MTQASYGQFCPIAMAAEIVCTRWTVVVIRELMAGSTRFNELRRGIPRLSPPLLSRRLKELEAAGIVTRAPSAHDRAVMEYRLSPSGLSLAPVVLALGEWGHHWIDTDASLDQDKLDVAFLMWDMRRNIQPAPFARAPGSPMTNQRRVVQFAYPELAPSRRSWWLVVDADGGVDLCSVDPGFEVDLHVSTDLRTMTAIWMGHDTIAAAQAADHLILTGDPRLAAAMPAWLGLSVFARERRLAG